jgi:hypothetical protein
LELQVKLLSDEVRGAVSVLVFRVWVALAEEEGATVDSASVLGGMFFSWFRATSVILEDSFIMLALRSNDR